MNLLIGKKWNITGRLQESDETDLLDKLLEMRGIRTPEAQDAFLRPERKIVHDPFLLDGMDTACGMIRTALDRQQRILIFGDFDVDGVTSTSILLLFLRSLGARVSFLIPDRLTEGYGLSAESTARIAAEEPDLVITVDNGISAVEEIGTLKSLGIGIIVTDHHECPEVLPDADAVIDPKIPGSAYPFSGLSGAGVALKLVQALSHLSGRRDAWTDYMGICALGTIGDMVPVCDENRSIVYHGLIQINASADGGIRSLYRKASAAPGQINAGTLGYVVAPRINAAGRMGDSTRAVHLLTEEDNGLRDRIADELLAENVRRQEIETAVYEEAREMIRSTDDTGDGGILVAYRKGWHPGVLGIVATRLAEHFGRTVIVFGGEGNIYKGSARSGDAISVLDAIGYASRHVLQYGGHRRAAGLAVEESAMPDFIAAVRGFSKEYYAGGPPETVFGIDLEISLSHLTIGSIERLAMLEPFGEGNPQPVLLCAGLHILGISGLSGGKHTKFLLGDEKGRTLEALAFGVQTNLLPYREGDRIDIAFNARINEWKGTRTVQAAVRELRRTPEILPYEETQEFFEKLYAGSPSEAVVRLAGRQGKRERHLPERDDFGPAYKFMLSRFSYESVFCDIPLLSDIIMAGCNLPMSAFRLNRIMYVFAETGLLELRRISPFRFIFMILPNVQKVSLSGYWNYLILFAEPGMADQ